MTVKKLREILSKCSDELELKVYGDDWDESFFVRNAVEGEYTFYIIVE